MRAEVRDTLVIRQGGDVMLILTRRIQEAIRVAENVRIVVLGIKGSQVRIGIEAPEEVVVDREEIYLRKQAESRKSHADSNPG